MDLTNISSMYNDIASNASAQSAAKLKDQLNNRDYKNATKDELMDACKEFEAYFLEQMYKSMIKTIPQSEGISSSNMTMMDYYKDQMVQNIAKETTDQNDMGLARMLYEQMCRNYGLSDEQTNSKEI